MQILEKHTTESYMNQNQQTEMVLNHLRMHGFKISPMRAHIINNVCAKKIISNIEDFWLQLRSKDCDVSWAATYSTLRLLNEYGVLEKTQDSKTVTYTVFEDFIVL